MMKDDPDSNEIENADILTSAAYSKLIQTPLFKHYDEFVSASKKYSLTKKYIDAMHLQNSKYFEVITYLNFFDMGTSTMKTLGFDETDPVLSLYCGYNISLLQSNDLICKIIKDKNLKIEVIDNIVPIRIEETIWMQIY